MDMNHRIVCNEENVSVSNRKKDICAPLFSVRDSPDLRHPRSLSVITNSDPASLISSMPLMLRYHRLTGYFHSHYFPDSSHR